MSDDAWGEDAWAEDGPGSGDGAPTRRQRNETGGRSRHARRRRGGPPWRVLGAAALAALLAAGVGWGLTREDEVPAGCPGGAPVAVAVAPELAATVRSTLGRVSKGDPCARFDVRPQAASQVAASINEDQAPDVWVPDSSTWVDAVDEDAPGGPWAAGPSIARSPVVLAARGGARPQSWADLLSGDDDLQMADPDVDTASRLAFHASRTGEPRQLDRRTGARLVVLSRFAAPSANALVTDAVADPKGSAPFPVSEQRLAELAAQEPRPPLRPVMPTEGTLSLDYPWMVSPQLSGPRARVAEQGRTAFGTLEVRRELEAAGFRGADGRRGPTIAGRAPARVRELRSLSRSQRLAAVEQWDVLRTDMRMLAVIDVSGSMAWPSTTPGLTRFDVAKGALLRGLDIIPAGSMVGGWVFSSDQAGEGVDHRQLAPVRRLDERVGEETQRARLRRLLERSDRYVEGDTGLYDSVWAGYRRMQDDYDPDYVNSVVVITDGKNDDPGGGLSLRELLRKIDDARDPSRPVRVITIGMGEADASALRRISAASGGTSYVADTPDDIERVFVSALLARES